MRQVFDVPDRGDVLWISGGARGRPGRTGRRAAVVLSPQAYNARVGLALVCPVSPRATGYPFEVAVPPGLPVTGVVLADQARAVDWRTLRAEKACALPAGSAEEMLAKLRALLA